jgi:predicted nucleic acid-binding protein
VSKFRQIRSISEDYEFARKLESKFEFKISFIDCMHIAISKRVGCILVTRDKLLIEKANDFILADKPENLIH